MSEFKVSKTSWHYRFYRWMEYMSSVPYSSWHDEGDNKQYHYRYFDNTVSYQSKNFCQYWRHVLLFPAIRFGCSFAMDAIIIGSLFITIFLVVTNPMMVAFTFLSVLLAGIGVFVALVMISLLFKASEKAVITNNTFIHTAYDAYKNKYCPVVTYNKDDE